MTTVHSDLVPPKHSQKKPLIPRWQLRPLVIISLIVAYSGILLITYPTAASWVSQYHQSIIVRDMNAQIPQSNAAAERFIREAQDYNEALSSGAVLESNANIAQGDKESNSTSHKYFDMLSVNGSGYMGRIIIPTIDLDLPIYHGTTDEVLEAGIGHLQGTSLPVGGVSTRAVLTGHRGLANAEMFTNLDKVAVGDTFSVSILGNVFTYKVRNIDVISPDESETIRPEIGKDLMTLITCTPLGINSHRILVTGERLFPSPSEDTQRALSDPSIPHFPWWIVWLGASAAALVFYAWWVGRPVLSERQRRQLRVQMQHRKRGTGRSLT